mmetsp:Transcript_50348/g.116226  ORF Transcript_50348/g.116226 Transcript_50348/m.116226 type:complete len:305 (-) Transcript_50348:4-918(-)
MAASCCADCSSSNARVRAVAVRNIPKSSCSSRSAAAMGTSSYEHAAWPKPARTSAAIAFAWHAKWKNGSGGAPSTSGRLTPGLPCLAMASCKIRMPAECSGDCHTENDSLPPGLRTRCASLSARSGWGRWSRPKPMTTESKLASGSGSAMASPSMSVTHGWASATGCACDSIAVEKSSATTSSAPRAAACAAITPVPVATSSSLPPPWRDSNGFFSTMEMAIALVRCMPAASSSAFAACFVTSAKEASYADAPDCHMRCSSAEKASVAKARRRLGRSSIIRSIARAAHAVPSGALDPASSTNDS